VHLEKVGSFQTVQYYPNTHCSYRTGSPQNKQTNKQTKKKPYEMNR